MEASQLVNFNKKQVVYIAKSKINSAGDGLFAKKFIAKNTPVVVYYGNKVTDEEIYNLYMDKPEEYYELNKYIRGTPNGFAIRGDKKQTNSNLMGVYVNDIGCISCKKENINEKVLKDYAQTVKKCNLMTMDTSDYPVYIASKRIKKGEELYAHYGIGYWLSFIGCSPEEISDMNRKYRFDSLY